jgi:hypothetical protein
MLQYATIEHSNSAGAGLGQLNKAWSRSTAAKLPAEVKLSCIAVAFKLCSGIQAFMNSEQACSCRLQQCPWALPLSASSCTGSGRGHAVFPCPLPTGAGLTTTAATLPAATASSRPPGLPANE